MSAPRHSWGDSYAILPAESPDGNERTERVCTRCGMVKVTIHYAHGFPGRAWRSPKNPAVTFEHPNTPPCLDAPQEVQAL